MKLNNKGFLITGILYSLLLLFLVLIIGMVAILSARQKKLDYISHDIITRLNDKYDFNIAKVWDFDYTGDYQTFTVPADGYYEIELWGAQGGGEYGGKGAYTKGIIYLNKGENLYIYVGNNPNIGETAFNGGGAPGNTYAYGGGGATDIRLEIDNLISRIMVSAGGGGMGATRTSPTTGGGEGGSFIGNDSYITVSEQEQVDSGKTSSPISTGATQTSGGTGGKWWSALAGLDGSFGIGGNGKAHDIVQKRSGAGGGGGYYGGASGTLYTSNEGSFSGSGGSSFISGLYGCDAILGKSTANAIVHTGQPNHYSGKVFSNGIMIAGNGEMPTHDGTTTMTGNTGNGFAKISLLSSSPQSYTATNLVKNGSFENSISGWDNLLEEDLSSDKKALGDKSLYIKDTSASIGYWYIQRFDRSIESGHILYYFIEIYTLKDYFIEYMINDGGTYPSSILRAFSNSNFERTSNVFTSDGGVTGIQLGSSVGQADTEGYIDNVLVIDLTEIFGAGNEPSKEWCDENISYFDGTTTIYK